MKKKLILGVIAGTALAAMAAKDPVLMTINGKDVKLSEFEYLYKKNNQQELQKESLDQYVDRFVLYKLKVADAENSKIDTLQSFVSEYNGYKDELMRPFMVDTTVNDKLLKEAYSHFLTNVDVSHIMVPRGNDYAGESKQKALIDSVYECLNKGEDFGELAKKYSVDNGTSAQGGRIGYISAGRFPYSFEKAAYETPVGSYSKPFTTRFGYHIVKVNATRKDRGTVHASHILRIFSQPITDSVKKVAKDSIDFIYNKLKAGEDFAELAKKYSQDPGTAFTGGDLNWFGSGEMIPQFEDQAFALNVNEFSKPFETNYGYHIIQVSGKKPTAAYEDMESTLKNYISADERSKEPQKVRLEQVKKQYNYKENPGFHDYILGEINKNGHFDSTFVFKKLAKSNYTIFSYNKTKVPASALVKSVKASLFFEQNKVAADYLESLVGPLADEMITNAYSEEVLNENVDYKNLLNEYRDGMLLFEASQKNVWNAASEDTVGLQRQFENNRSKYAWSEPHFKGIILLAKNDSIATLVKKDINKFGADTLTTALHHKYGRSIRMERMLVAKGESKQVDYLVFGGEKVISTDSKYPVYFVLEGGAIDQPQNYTDVRGQVTSDYQDALEKKWTEELKKKYPVVINKDVLKKVQ